MDFVTLKRMFDKDYPKVVPQRVKDLNAYGRVLDGSIYSKLAYPFSQEFDDTNNEPVPIDQRRPSVKYNLPKIVTDEVASLTFGESHAPYIRVYDPFNDDEETPEDKYTAKLIQYIRHSTQLDAAMYEAIKRGAPGSVCAVIKTTKDGAPWIRIVAGEFMWPTFDPQDPSRLIKNSEIYPTTLGELLDGGYTPSELGYGQTDKLDRALEYWMNITTDDKVEQWMKPLKREDFNRLGDAKGDPSQGRYEWESDTVRTYTHRWGEVPIIWCRNLHEREKIDGPCTFADIVDITIELDYLMSQIGRGFKYSMDPITAVTAGDLKTRMPSGGMLAGLPGSRPNWHRTPAKILDVDSGGEAKMLEIGGSGLGAAKEWCKVLREWALEVAGGMKSDQEHAGGPQSGRALELLHQALLWLVGRMRTDYGDGFMIPIIRLLMRGLKTGIISLWGVTPAKIPDHDIPLLNVWPSWWQPRGSDFYQTVQALVQAAGGTPTMGVQIAPIRLIMELFASAAGAPDPISVADQAMAEYQKHHDEQITLNTPKPAAPSSAAA